MTTEHLKEHTDETSTSVQAMQLDPSRQQQNGLTGEWLWEIIKTGFIVCDTQHWIMSQICIKIIGQDVADERSNRQHTVNSSLVNALYTSTHK